MDSNKNELSINISNASNISVKNINQMLTNNEKGELKKEIEEMLALLKLSNDEKEKLTNRLEEAKLAVETNKPKNYLSKILSDAGSFLKDFTKEAGKTAISALISGHM